MSERVGAICSACDGHVKFFGYGNYVGNEDLPDELCDISGFKNPKIVLDNGDVVWGIECWWGGEEEVKLFLDQCKSVEIVSISQIRKNKINTGKGE